MIPLTGTVFCNLCRNKTLFLCDKIDHTIQPYVHHDDAVFIDELNAHTVKTMIHEMQQSQVHAGVFYHPNMEELKKAFQKKIYTYTGRRWTCKK